MELVARPTTYRGIPMRSRLEARVAAYLDVDGSPWEYEPRAFASRRGQYLPDFLVTDDAGRRVYIEVRPTVHRARSALDQMPIIWASELDAWLMILIPDLHLAVVATRYIAWAEYPMMVEEP
jgi:hypothetical protein